jgi:hypothetical protein
MEQLPVFDGSNSFQRRRAYGEYVRQRNTRIPPPPPLPPVRHVSVHMGLSLKILRLTSQIMLNVNDKGGDIVCVICQEMPTHYQIMRVLLCGHKYHINCIEEWLQDNVTCPLCKTNLYECVQIRESF